MNNRRLNAMNMKNIVGLCWVCLLLLVGCTSDEVVQKPLADGVVEVKFRMLSMQEGTDASTESQINDVKAFRFEDDILEEVFDHLNPDSKGVLQLKPLEMKGQVYFLVNASAVLSDVTLIPGTTTLTDFLNLEASAEAMTAAGISMTGRIELSKENASQTVVLKRSVARIDLDSSFEGVQVQRLTIGGIASVGYVNERAVAEIPASAEVQDFVCSYDDQPFENRKETLTYVCEQGGQARAVEVMVTIGGVWHRLRTTLPAAQRNKVYTLKIYGNGADARIEVLADDWESGESSDTELNRKGLIDKNASQLAEGVEVSAEGDTVYVPYWKCDFRLAVKAEAGTTVKVNGFVDGVDIVQQPISKTMQNVSDVQVSSMQKVPGSIQEYVYLDVYDQTTLKGRIVLVFRPNPITLSGKVVFDKDGLCDLNAYADGELGVLTLPEGKQIRVQVADGESAWMKLAAADGNGVYRILGGWKPNDPKADGRVQEAKLLISDADGGHQETYTIRRRNWGLPVVNINGTWWCKYNLRGNVKSFADQVLINDDPAKKAGKTLWDYLQSCTNEELLAVWGDNYQGNNPEGLKLKVKDGKFYYEGYSSSMTSVVDKLDPSVMAPEGYQIPAFGDYKALSASENFNMGYDTKEYQLTVGGQAVVKSFEREGLQVDGTAYGVVHFHQIQLKDATTEGVVLFGPGYQYKAYHETNAFFKPLVTVLANYAGNQLKTWCLEEWEKTTGKGNWFKVMTNWYGANDTRTVRCIKTPVEYIYE